MCTVPHPNELSQRNKLSIHSNLCVVKKSSSFYPVSLTKALFHSNQRLVYESSFYSILRVVNESSTFLPLLSFYLTRRQQKLLPLYLTLIFLKTTLSDTTSHYESNRSVDITLLQYKFYNGFFCKEIQQTPCAVYTRRG